MLDTVAAKDLRCSGPRTATGIRCGSVRTEPLDNKIDGVVVMLVDIDLLKLAHAYTESIVATVREPLLVLDTDLRVRTASASFYKTYRVKPDQTH